MKSFRKRSTICMIVEGRQEAADRSFISCGYLRYLVWQGREIISLIDHCWESMLFVQTWAVSKRFLADLFCFVLFLLLFCFLFFVCLFVFCCCCCCFSSPCLFCFCGYVLLSIKHPQPLSVFDQESSTFIRFWSRILNIYPFLIKNPQRLSVFDQESSTLIRSYKSPQHLSGFFF